MKAPDIAPYRSLLFLLAGCVLSGGLVAWEWRTLKLPPTASLPRETSEGLASTSVTDDLFQMMPIQSYREMVNMPLFFKGRAEQAALAESTDDGSLKLMGVVLAPQGFVALIKDKQGLYYKLHQGAAIHDWTVASVQNDQIKLVKDSESRQLLLFSNNKPQDLTSQDLEACFKNKPDLPLEACHKSSRRRNPSSG